MSRAGSQVMKTGSRIGRPIGGDGDGAVGCAGAFAGDEAREGLETRSIIRAILSSSSGQISGQWVNPK